MEKEKPRPETLISLADLASMAGVSRPAVTNWRRRHADFPVPVEESGAATLFRLSEITSWMSAHGKSLTRPTVEQSVWAAFNSVRSIAPIEDAAIIGMAMLGSAVAATRLGELVDRTLQHVIESDPAALQSSLAELATRLDGAALPTILDVRSPSKPQWSYYSPFLKDMARLALEFGPAEVFEALLATSLRSSRGAGESASPPSVTRLVTTLFPVQGTVLDFACGQGGFLLAAARGAGPAEFRLVGQDVNDSACRVSQVRMLVHGVEAEITRGDSLHCETQPGVQADLVFADPPFALKWAPERDLEPSRWQFGPLPHSKADLAWVQHAISRLRPGGHAVIVTSYGPLFRGGDEAQVRKNLVAAGCVQAVIALPPALYQTTAIPPAILVLGSPSPGGRPHVSFMDASRKARGRKGRTTLDDDDVDGIVSMARALLAGRTPPKVPGIDAATISTERLLAGDCSLLPSRWVDASISSSQIMERFRSNENFLRSLDQHAKDDVLAIPVVEAADTGPTGLPQVSSVAVHDLAEVFSARNIDPDMFGTGTTPVIRARDIGHDLTVTPSETIDLDLLPYPTELTQPGDVLVLTVGQIRAAVDHIGGAIVAGPVQIMRPRPGVTDSTVLAAIVTNFAQRQARGVTHSRIDLKSLQIPRIDLASSRQLRVALDTLNERRRHVTDALEAIDDLSQALVVGLGSGALRFEEKLPRAEHP